MSDGGQKIEWLSAAEACEVLGVCRSALSNAVSRANGVSGLNCQTIGNMRVWHVDDIDTIRRLHCMDVPLGAAIKVAAAIRQGEFNA